MNKIKAQLVSLVLFLAAILIFIVIVERLHVDQFFLALFHSLKPFLLALVLVFFIQPLILRLSCFSYKLRTCLIYSLLGCFVLLFICLLSWYVYVKKEDFMQWGNQIFQDSYSFIKLYPLEQVIDKGQIKQVMLQTSEKIMQGITRFIGNLSLFGLSFIIAFFISIEMETLTNEFKKYNKNYQSWYLFYVLFSHVFLNYCYSTFIDTFYIIVVTSIILYVFQTPSFLLLSVILALLNLFPYIGAMLGTLLILLVHAMSGQGNLVLLIIVLVLSSQVESNVVHPLIYHKTMKIHPLFLFLAMLINEFMFGLMGVVLSPILAVFLQMGVKSYLEALNQSGMGGWEDLK